MAGTALVCERCVFKFGNGEETTARPSAGWKEARTGICGGVSCAAGGKEIRRTCPTSSAAWYNYRLSTRWIPGASMPMLRSSVAKVRASRCGPRRCWVERRAVGIEDVELLVWISRMDRTSPGASFAAGISACTVLVRKAGGYGDGLRWWWKERENESGVESVSTWQEEWFDGFTKTPSVQNRNRSRPPDVDGRGRGLGWFRAERPLNTLIFNESPSDLEWVLTFKLAIHALGHPWPASRESTA
ncbi:hypothetical protein GGX14DRAFT_397094 [Mycena pura]|uniref:Uncharacterized protein n=1 Tax=Mycena pura TaxID=153505 RepID=A0AAD6YEW4_9AGAR|nr:hypothetical protein GGX14DRAFT_397094 [Mycena pura]